MIQRRSRLASCTNRLLRSALATNSGGRTLTAIKRSRWPSRALYTTPHAALTEFFDNLVVQ